MDQRDLRRDQETLNSDSVSEKNTLSYDRPAHFKDYDPPRTKEERIFTSIWQDLFGINQIGIHDNYFELGGDSLLAMNVVARVKKAGYTLNAQQLFEYPTVAELASLQLHTAQDDTGSTGTQDLIVGEVPLIPAIQRFLYGRKSPSPHHWNLAGLVKSDQPLKSKLLKEVTEHLIWYHDSLRLRFVKNGTSWKAAIVGPPDDLPFKVIDLSKLADEQQKKAIESTVSEMQTSLDLSNGPLVWVIHFDLGPNRPHRLFIVMHHFTSEGISWRIFWGDFETAYLQRLRGENISLPLKTTSFKRWAVLMNQHAQSEKLKREADYWMNLSWGKIKPLPMDFPKNRIKNTNESAREVRFRSALGIHKNCSTPFLKTLPRKIFSLPL